ncbi:MAG: hypothetical protein VX346_09850 [Planctomycetota bacterium]|nr:hypothetical protein [Planctomycetota bacterium]
MSLPRFVLLDNSLVEVGGHFLEHAVCLLKAAELAGLQPVLATNRDFEQRDAVPPGWLVYPIFRYTALGRYSSFNAQPEKGIAAQSRSGLRVFLKQCLGRRKRIRSFAASCDRLFAGMALEQDDHVCLPFCTELSLLGVLKYLNRCPVAAKATWHLYYHSSCLQGRPSDWAAQERQANVMKQALRQSEELVEQGRLRFYATTPHVCDSLNELSRVTFRYLPFPVEVDSEVSSTNRSVGSPLRLLLGGQPRAEKGVTHRAEYVNSLWSRGLGSGELQLRMQQQPGTPPLEVPPKVQHGLLHNEPPPVVFAPYPLSYDGYREFLRSADVGLLMYDGEAYYSRISSVMLELLCLGIPVIVPAGCWMGEIVAEANTRYLERVSQLWQPMAVDGLTLSQSQRQSAGDHNVGPEAQCGHIETGSTLIPHGASVWCPRFYWTGPEARGTYLRLDVLQTDHYGETVKDRTMVLHRSAETSLSSALFELHTQARAIHWSISDAYADAAPPQGQMNSRFFARPVAVPSGSIGLVAVDRRQVPALVTEVMAHYEHYRQEARVYGTALAQRHTVAGHLSQLLDCGAQTPQVAMSERHCA